MFGAKKKLQEAERYGIAATRAVYRRNALECLNKQVNDMRGKNTLAMLRGALDLALKLELITIEEGAQIDEMGVYNYEALLKAEKEYKERRIAEYEAQRAVEGK